MSRRVARGLTGAWRSALSVGLVLLAGCAAPAGPGAAQAYRCEHGIDFKVRFVDDSALLDGARTSGVLFRDAGGQGPQQQVFSNGQIRAEFGLGASGREARLTYPLLPLTARCTRDQVP